MNVDAAQRLLDDAHSADAWDETCDALSWALREIGVIREQAARTVVAKQHALDAMGGRAIRAENALGAIETLSASEGGAMDLWWTASGDEWAVPNWLPGKFLRAVLDLARS